MAQILVRNVEERLKTRLQKRARRNGHSVEAEVGEILRKALKAEDAPTRGRGSEMVALFSGSGVPRSLKHFADIAGSVVNPWG